MDHEPCHDSRSRLQGVCPKFQSHVVQRSGGCGPGEGGRDEVYRHHVRTPPRLCHLRFEGGWVQHRAGDTVQARSFEGACGGVQGSGHPAGVLLLAGPGLDSTGRHRLQNWRLQTTHVPLGPCAGRQPCAVPGNQGDSAGQGVAKQLRRVSGDYLVRYSRVWPANSMWMDSTHCLSSFRRFERSSKRVA